MSLDGAARVGPSCRRWLPAPGTRQHSSPISRVVALCPLHQGEVSCVGSDLPGPAGQVLLLLVSFLLLPPLLSSSGTCCGPWTFFLAFKWPGSSKNLEKSGPEQMCLWTAVPLLTACDGL